MFTQLYHPGKIKLNDEPGEVAFGCNNHRTVPTVRNYADLITNQPIKTSIGGENNIQINMKSEKRSTKDSFNAWIAIKETSHITNQYRLGDFVEAAG